MAIDRVAAADSVGQNVIHRLEKPPVTPVDYQYLLVSRNIRDAQHVDVLTISDFRQVKDRLKKEVKSGVGIEMTVAAARKMDATDVGSWILQIRELYKFCRLSRCQFILSSGADSPYSMVSGPCFDALLKVCGIDPQNYWPDLEGWLESRLARRVTAC